MLFPYRFALQRDSRNPTGRIRGLAAGNYPEQSDEQIAQTFCGAVSQVYGLPSRTERVRLGESWQVKMRDMICNANYSLVVNTTQSQTVVLESMNYYISSLMGETNAAQVSLYYKIGLAEEFPTRPTVPDNGSTLSWFAGLSGQAQYSGALQYYWSANADDPTTLPNTWYPLGERSICPKTTDGTDVGLKWHSVEVPFNGRLTLPPGYAFGIWPRATGAPYYAVVGACLRWDDGPVYKTV